MPLKTGSLADLAPLPEKSEPSILFQLTHQMLSALDYLSSRNLCHRDVKPANILFSTHHDQHHFQLADFGLANHQQLAGTVCGTRVYAAPELHPDYGLGRYRQTPKMDVWSLFVTIASQMSSAKFDQDRLAYCSYHEILASVRAAAAQALAALEPMARENPDLRASAAQILVVHFNGQGLTTLSSEVGEIPEVPAPAPAERPRPSRTTSSRPAPALGRPRNQQEEASRPVREPKRKSPPTPRAPDRITKSRTPPVRQRSMPGSFDWREMEF